MRVTWHERGQALCVASSSPHDPAGGEKLLALAPGETEPRHG